MVIDSSTATPVQAMKNANVAQQIDVSLTKKALDVVAEQAQGVLNMLPQPAKGLQPHLGQHLDTFA